MLGKCSPSQSHLQVNRFWYSSIKITCQGKQYLHCCKKWARLHPQALCLSSSSKADEPSSSMLASNRLTVPLDTPAVSMQSKLQGRALRRFNSSPILPVCRSLPASWHQDEHSETSRCTVVPVFFKPVCAWGWARKFWSWTGKTYVGQSKDTGKISSLDSRIR